MSGLDAAAVAVIEAEYDRWRATFTLPALDSDITPGFRALALRMYTRYGPAALKELERIAVERCGAEGQQFPASGRKCRDPGGMPRAEPDRGRT